MFMEEFRFFRQSILDLDRVITLATDVDETFNSVKIFGSAKCGQRVNR